MTIVGHQDVQKTLLALEASERFPHSMLFHGPQGVGKRLVAETMAHRLLCGGDQGTLNVNISHALYPQILVKSCPDFHIIEPEEGKKSIGIAHIKQTLEKLTLSSDGQRVLIVDAAENMTHEAANAILKTLEEPGKNIHFILISHNLSKLLPTIVSRCRKLRFSPLSDDETSQVLQNVSPKLDMDQLSHFTQAAQGCPGQALALGEAGIALKETLENFVSSPSQPTAFVDKIQKAKQAPLALTLLLKYMQQAQNSHKWAKMYKQTHQDILNMQTLNLSPQWLLEKTLRDMIKTS